jgi:hypothetical protein
MGVSSDSAKDIVRIGANITITAESGFSSDTVKDIVRIAASKSQHVTVHAKKYSSDTLKDIARIGKENVTIVV